MLKTAFRAAVISAAAIGTTATFQPTMAQAEPFLGQISLFPYSFCPRGWTETDGQLLAISSYTALFSLIGTTYGGDGRTTFAVPDLRGRSPIGRGRGPGLDDIRLGEKGGRESVTISQLQMPLHSHTASTEVQASSTLHAQSSRSGAESDPTGNVLSGTTEGIYSPRGTNVDMSDEAISTTASASTTVGNAGGSQSFASRNPYLGLRWCIALQGIFPSRS